LVAGCCCRSVFAGANREVAAITWVQSVKVRGIEQGPSDDAMAVTTLLILTVLLALP